MRGWWQVKIRGTPSEDNTIELDFRRIILLRRSKLPFLFGKITFFLPPRSVINAIAKWCAKCVCACTRCPWPDAWSSRGRGSRGKAESAPKAQLQLMYLDDDLWVHKTGEGNVFVQQRISPSESDSPGAG